VIGDDAIVIRDRDHDRDRDRDRKKIVTRAKDD